MKDDKQCADDKNKGKGSADDEPHVVISPDCGHIHVIPFSCIRNVAQGKLDLMTVPCCGPILRLVFKEWLQGLELERAEAKTRS